MSSHLGSRVPAQNMVPQHLASDSASGFFAPRFANRVRRRSSLRRALHTEPRFAELSEGFASVRSILLDILNSALDVAAAEQGFVLISRESTVLEVACARHLRPGQVMDLVLGEASQSVHSALREGRMTAVGLNGQPMPVLDGFFEPNRPALLCLPLDLGPRQTGVLCLIRRQAPRKLSELDLDMVQGLAEQAALAIGAANHQSALTRLHASLASLSPA